MSRSAALQPATAGHSNVNSGERLHKCSCGKQSGKGGQCDACKKNEEESLHRKASGAGTAHEAPSIVRDVLRDPGQPLDAGTRRLMESRFGHDFSRVRVHTNAQASASAVALAARAYARGDDIVFAAGNYAPGTTAGQRLLAHELVHVVQHRAAPPRQDVRLTSTRNQSAERQAQSLALRIASARPIGAWQPVAPDAHLSLESETWYRGEVEGVAAAKDTSSGKGVVHDLGEGKYFSDRQSVAAEYSETRGDAKTPAGARRVIGGQIDPAKLGKVLDLTKDSEFMKSFGRVKEKLKHVSGEPYRNLVTHHLNRKGVKLEDFQIIIGPEGRLGGKQMCVRDAGVLKKVLASMSPIKPGGGGPAGGASSQGKQTAPGGAPKAGPKPAAKTPQAGDATTPGKSVAGPSKAPSLPAAPKASTASTARSFARSLRNNLKLLANATVLDTGIKVVGALADLHKFFKFTDMAASKLGGGAFVLTKEVELAEDFKKQAEQLNKSYDAFSERVRENEIAFLEAGQDAHAAKTAMAAITALHDSPNFADLAAALPKRIAALSTAAKEARQKRDAIDKFLSDPPFPFDSDDLALMFAGYEDLSVVAAALERAVSALKKLNRKVKGDRKYLDEWHFAMLKICIRGGACSFLD